MPTVAQKLCHEIVEPMLAPSSNDLTRSRKSFKSIRGNPLIRCEKPTRSVVIEKKKVISQLEPASKTVLNKFKSKESFLRKDFTDAAVNTLISGPLTCDNNCVTNVRKRDNHCKCKHEKKINFKFSTKQIQTLNKSCSKSDKACTHCIDTANCGTQFIDNLNSKLRTQISNRLLFKRSSKYEPQFDYMNSQYTSSRVNKLMSSNQNGKRWALSKYTARGPDF